MLYVHVKMKDFSYTINGEREQKKWLWTICWSRPHRSAYTEIHTYMPCASNRIISRSLLHWKLLSWRIVHAIFHYTLIQFVFFQFTLWKEKFLRSMEHREKKLYKILSESRDNSFFRNDNSRVYTTSTMHLNHFWHTICIRAIWLVMLQYNLYPPSFLQIVRFMSLFARVRLLLLLTVSNEFHAKN